MKRLAAILFMVTLLCGCEKIFTPSKITMSPMETRIVETTIQPQTLFISDYDGNGTEPVVLDEETQSYTVTYQWLTASISLSSYNEATYTYELVLTSGVRSDNDEWTLYVGGVDKDYQDSMDVSLR